MNRTRIRLLLVFAVVAAASAVMYGYGVSVFDISPGRGLTEFLALAFGVAAVYELVVIGLAALLRMRDAAESEVGMLAGLFRAVAILIVAIAFLHFWGKLPGSWAAVAGFAGLLMGWSLQAPVSGIAAWALVNVKRPFRVGDRVMLPAWGLTGDVTQIGMMYTVLNQVGGTVGSEEAAGRNILIPNAMLFGNVVINYTPQQSAAYVLDEVIVRITYNSNWDLAEGVLMECAKEVTKDIIEQSGHEPYIRADFYDYGVFMRLRYMTSATDRPRIVYEITKRIFKEFSKYPDVDFAIPYVFSHRTGLRAAARHLEPPKDAATVQVELDVDQILDLTGVSDKPENETEIRELARSISDDGLLQPIVVQRREDGRYIAVAGQMRLAACKMLGWKSIPATVKLKK